MIRKEHEVDKMFLYYMNVPLNEMGINEFESCHYSLKYN